MSDESDRKDYEDYLEYQKHISGSPSSGISHELSPKAPPGVDQITNGIASGGIGEIAAPLAGIPKLIGSAGKSLAGFFKPAVARTAAMDLVKNEAALGPAAAQKMGEAESQFNRKVISPKMTEQYARADAQSVPFNPADYSGIHPKIDEMVERMSQGGVKEIPMKDALDLRAAVNNKSMFKDLGPYSDEIAARSQKALGAGDTLRNAINTTDPEIGKISSDLKDDYSLRKAVTKGSDKRPISAVEAPIGSDKASLLSQFDERAGTNLRQYGQDISKAKSRLGQSAGAWSPGSYAAITNKAVGYAPRAYDSLASMMQPAAQAAGNALQSPVGKQLGQFSLQSLLQRKNEDQ